MICWDETKRTINLEKHGLDFADAHLVYSNPDKVVIQSARKEEARRLDLAFVEEAEAVLALVYVERGSDTRIISFRRASRRERELYEQD